MSSQEHDRTALPKPVALTPEQLQQVAAGTAMMLPVSVIRGPIIAGPYPVGPEWGGVIAPVATFTAAR